MDQVLQYYVGANSVDCFMRFEIMQIVATIECTSSKCVTTLEADLRFIVLARVYRYVEENVSDFFSQGL